MRNLIVTKKKKQSKEEKDIILRAKRLSEKENTIVYVYEIIPYAIIEDKKITYIYKGEEL